MRTERKSGVTVLKFEGVAVDGGLIFKSKNWTSGDYTPPEIVVKLTEYNNGVAKFKISSEELVSTVARHLDGMFGKENYGESNIRKINAILVDYRNSETRIHKDLNLQEINNLLIESIKDYDKKDIIDTKICKTKESTRDSDEFYRRSTQTLYTSYIFDEVKEIRYKNFWNMLGYPLGKFLQFKNLATQQYIKILSLKDGIITATSLGSSTLQDFVSALKCCFIPYSNMYGIKGIDIKFNQFAIRVNESNIDKIEYLYNRGETFLEVNQEAESVEAAYEAYKSVR